MTWLRFFTITIGDNYDSVKIIAHDVEEAIDKVKKLDIFKEAAAAEHGFITQVVLEAEGEL
jgi:hypothetical protein